jgi:GNAT superfamily N-acetyltransferase
MSFEIIRASFEHLDTLSVLFDGYRQFYRQPPDVEAARAFLQARLANEESVIFLASGEPGGMGFTQLYPTFSSVSMKRLWILNDLFVAPHARKLGVGEALLERARTFAGETGAKGLMLETAVDNLTAQRLYERLGWERETEFYMYNWRV